MNPILVAVDEHPHAEKIVDCAIELAKSTGAKIIITYVIPEKSIPSKYKDSHGDALPEHYYEDLFQRTVAGLTERITKSNISCEGIYGVGNPTKFILANAKSKKASFIVVGIHGFRRLGRVKALGDVARNVIEGSQVPVIAVP